MVTEPDTFGEYRHVAHTPDQTAAPGSRNGYRVGLAINTDAPDRGTTEPRHLRKYYYLFDSLTASRASRRSS